MEYFFCAKDIPGENNFMPKSIVGGFGSGNVEEIFLSSDKPVLYHGQPVGIILATTFQLANQAAKKVKITYRKPETGNTSMSSPCRPHSIH